MEIVDANIVLRYLLHDNEALSVEATRILENREVVLLTEVCAEIIYVLEKVYKGPRHLINNSISTILEFPNITSNKKIIAKALLFYTIENVDFVDSILIANNHLHETQIHTFDKKLKKLCK